MNEDTFKDRLASLVSEINTLPEADRARLMKLAEETRDRYVAQQRNFKRIREGVDAIRLNTRYLNFDLEATRRECDTLAEALKRGRAGN